MSRLSAEAQFEQQQTECYEIHMQEVFYCSGVTPVCDVTFYFEKPAAGEAVFLMLNTHTGHASWRLCICSREFLALLLLV